MIARLFSKIFKKEGIILIDHAGQKYICGEPRKEKPIIIKLLKKNLNWKLAINPDLSFPEAYMHGDIIIENASLREFLDLVFKNVGREEIATSAYIIKKLLQEQIVLDNKKWSVLSNSWVIFFIICGFLNLYVANFYTEEEWVEFKFYILGIILPIIFIILNGIYIGFYTKK